MVALRPSPIACNQTRSVAFTCLRQQQEVHMRGFIIGALIVAVGLLGYLYWDSEHNTLFKAPGIEIKK